MSKPKPKAVRESFIDLVPVNTASMDEVSRDVASTHSEEAATGPSPWLWGLVGLLLLLEIIAGVGLLRVDSREATSLDLVGVDLSSAVLVGAPLGDADLRRSNLQAAVLTNADLSGATLVGACLRDAHLEGADLRGTDLSAADLRGAQLEGAVTSGRTLFAASIHDEHTRWPDADSPPGDAGAISVDARDVCG